MGERRDSPCRQCYALGLLLLAAWTVRAEPEGVELPAPRPVAALDLTEVLQLTLQNQPELRIALQRVEAARGRMIQAGLYPNPTLGWRSSDMGHNRDHAGEQGPILYQTLVPLKKLQLSRAAAAYGVQAFDWQAITRWYDVAARVRSAFYAVLAAQLEVQTFDEIVRISQEVLDNARKLERAGAGNRPDVLRALVELEQNRVQLQVSRRNLEAARRVLAAAVGADFVACASLQGDLEVPPPQFEWKALVDITLGRSSEVQEAYALVLQAEKQAQRARAENLPDWQMVLRAYHHFPDRDNRFYVEAGPVWPLLNQNQGNIRAADADVARARAEVRRVELSLVERLALAFQRYQVGLEQADSYRRDVLPNAREALRLVELGFRSGDPKYDYTAVLQAQQIFYRARLIYVQALGAQWRAVADLLGLLQIEAPFNDSADSGPAVPDVKP